MPINADGNSCPCPKNMPAKNNPAKAATTTDKRGVIKVDEETMKTSMDRVFAGGDIANGGATAVLAYGEGKRAAGAIIEMLDRESGKGGGA